MVRKWMKRGMMMKFSYDDENRRFTIFGNEDMIYTYKITCPYCSHKFEWHDGKVGDKIYLHCDICGKELLCPDDEESLFPEYPSCECGGWFEKAERWTPYVCPKCKEEIERREVRGTIEVEVVKDE